MNGGTATPEGSTIDGAEVEKFGRMAATWWDESGTSGPLHRLNPVRMGYIRRQVETHLSLEEVSHLKPFAGLAMADIGCGGGIVCEPLARLGASVTGVDASLDAIEVAKVHAVEAGLQINYRAGTSDQLAATGARFDVVLALEVVEHVADVPAFIASLKALLKPNGLLIMSTPNRTAKSFAAVIVGAEYVMRWLPRGTHDWRRFLRPSELARELRANGLAVQDVSGIVYDPVKREFSLSGVDVAVNYLMSATAKP